MDQENPIYKDALYRLGVCYQEGDGVQQDYKLAARLYMEAVEKGNIKAEHGLGSSVFFKHLKEEECRQSILKKHFSSSVGEKRSSMNQS